jgi:N-formylglutamate amidohydrolase
MGRRDRLTIHGFQPLTASQTAPQSVSIAEPAPTNPIEVLEPERHSVPLVFASPHSGSFYPRDFVAASPLELATLRRSEDCYVDELFSDAPKFGAPLVRALYPRAYLDVNREPYELDPEMFNDPLPAFANTTSARVGAGLGTIPRIVATRREIYRTKLYFQDAERRIETVYRPYHQALAALIARAHARFGFCILIDCHSMPSTGLPVTAVGDPRTIDMVLGDRTGLSCAPIVTDSVDAFLSQRHYRVTRNNPYAGGFTTQNYGDPDNGTHVLQLEINRNLYMDETSLEQRPGFSVLKADIGILISRLVALAGERAGALRRQRLSAE